MTVINQVVQVRDLKGAGAFAMRYLDHEQDFTLVHVAETLPPGQQRAAATVLIRIVTSARGGPYFSAGLTEEKALDLPAQRTRGFSSH